MRQGYVKLKDFSRIKGTAQNCILIFRVLHSFSNFITAKTKFVYFLKVLSDLPALFTTSHSKKISHSECNRIEQTLS